MFRLRIRTIDGQDITLNVKAQTMRQARRIASIAYPGARIGQHEPMAQRIDSPVKRTPYRRGQCKAMRAACSDWTYRQHADRTLLPHVRAWQ